MPPPKPKKTSKRQYNIFVLEAKKWVDYFGLNDWEFHFTHKHIDSDICSCVSMQLSHHFAIINLETSWNSGDNISSTDNNIREAAFHEVCEVMLCKIREELDIAKVPNTEELIHDIIVRLENSILKCQK